MRMTDVLADIPTFVAVVEAGGFAAASRRLNLSRSTVGKSIARLEDRLGVRLFHRTTRTQSLTDEGSAFYERCLHALEELKAGREQLEADSHAVNGRLRVSVPVHFGRLCVAPVLAKLAMDHPALKVEVQFGDRLVDLIGDRFDLAVRMHSPGTGVGLVSRRIAREETIVCASPRYLRARGAPRVLEELHSHHAITYAFADRPETWRFPAPDGRIEETTPPSRICLGDLEAIANAAVDGLGLAWLPTWLVGERLRNGELQRVLPRVPALISDVHVVWVRSSHLPSRIRAAIDALVADVHDEVEG
jgi:DNA-binding transcriptional LysR family regulator